MERQLVYSSEGAGHPFRRKLAPHVLAGSAEWHDKSEKWWQRENTHLFVISFCAFFTVFYTFIA
jgi:hypothetical protein